MAVNLDHNCYGEPWAAINTNGTWSDEGDHGTTPIALKGVVEWPNTTLDCVQVVTPADTPTVTPLPGASTGSLWCTDLNKANLGQCVGTTDGSQLCPLDQVQCTETTTSTSPATATATGGVSYDFMYNTAPGCDGSSCSPVYVYVSSTQFSGGVQFNAAPLCDGSECSPVDAYASSTSFPGSVMFNAAPYCDGSECAPVYLYGEPLPGVYGGTTTYSCPSGGTLSGTNCVTYSNVCSTDSSLPCKQIAGSTATTASGNPATYCSPDTCQSNSSGWVTANDTQSGSNDKTNNGARDASGKCLGQIYLFNGTDMRCRVFDRNGMTDAYAKLVGEIALSCTGAGAALAGALGMSGAMATAITNAAIQIAVNTSIDAATGQLNSGSLISAGISPVASLAGAGAATSGWGDSLANGMASVGTSTGSSSLLNPALQDVVQQIGNVVQQYSPAIQQGMLGNYSQTKCCYPDKLSPSCTPQEISEATNQHNGLCHVVGSYVSSRLLMIDMVKKQTSCCFSSKLGRIFHEQGRPQLTSFGTDGGWGTPKSPVCRGFTPEEFQSLDFSHIDLSEYEADLSSKMNQIAPIITNYMNQVGQATSQQLQNMKPQ